MGKKNRDLHRISSIRREQLQHGGLQQMNPLKPDLNSEEWSYPDSHVSHHRITEAGYVLRRPAGLQVRAETLEIGEVQVGERARPQMLRDVPMKNPRLGQDREVFVEGPDNQHPSMRRTTWRTSPDLRLSQAKCCVLRGCSNEVCSRPVEEQEPREKHEV